MKVYIAHSREFDYQNELYTPIRKCVELKDIILPHESGYDNNQTREFYKTLDLMIAEVSYPATGLGIELGWAFDDHIPIICLYQNGAKVSGSIKVVTNEIYSYNNTGEMLKIIKEAVTRYSKDTK